MKYLALLPIRRSRATPPTRGRELKSQGAASTVPGPQDAPHAGARIEIHSTALALSHSTATPPTRGRELKLYELGYTTATAGRPPRGGEN